MKFYTSTIALASCATAMVVPPGSAPKFDVDIAVIGGGSSGIHAAVNLKDYGLDVAVIEKEGQIGGHAQTYINPVTKRPTNIGVTLFENTKTVQKYIGRLGVALAKNNPFSAANTNKQYDFTLGIPIPAQSQAQAAATKEATAAALQAYAQNVLPKYPWLDQGYLLPNPVPKELLMPFGEFAAKNNFSAILPLISQLNWYPGNITAMPTIYGIKKFGPGLLQSVSSNFLVAASGDTRSIYKAAAKVLGDNSIYLNSEVVSVRRKAPGQGVVVVFKQKGKTITLRARKLVVAIPQTRANTKMFDLCEKERKLITKFSAYGYVAGVAHIPGLDHGLQNIGALTPANVPLIPGSNGYFETGSPNDFLLGAAFDNTDYTLADAEALMRKELATVARAGGAPADAAEKVTFPMLEDHAPYYLHVTGHDIAHGFYHDLIALEGYRNTYWTGAVFAGQNSGLIWNWNDGTVLPAIKLALALETSQ